MWSNVNKSCSEEFINYFRKDRVNIESEISVNETFLKFTVDFRKQRHHPCWENSKYESSRAIGRKGNCLLSYCIKFKILTNRHSGALVDQILAWVSY